MVFNDMNEVKRTLNILEKLYKNNKFIYSPFIIKDKTIVFTADSYYDPVLTLLKLKQYNIIDFSIRNVTQESDEITITHCHIDAFKMISERSPTYQNIEKLCEEQKILSMSADAKINQSAVHSGFFSKLNQQILSNEKTQQQSERTEPKIAR